MMPAAPMKLFTPLKLAKGLVLKNRVVMAPMTRARSDPVTRQATNLNAEYYEQRAGAGLIITEATAVSEQGHNWYGAPALYTDQHAEAWKKVVDRVHAKDGKIFAQLWHLGRQGHPSFNAKKEVVSPSAIPLEDGQIRDASGNPATYGTPRALETDEIAEVADDYRRSAQLAKEAGFDGVEIHGANGYLIDQFLQSVSNTRTDKYGGSIENRARFALEVTDAIKTVWASDRIGIRLSPNSPYAGMGSSDNPEQFIYTMQKLGERGIGYVSLLDGFGFGVYDKARPLTVFDAKTAFKGHVLANNSYTRDIAEGAIRSGAADFVTFGRPFISNPDLAERFENDWPLNPLPSPEFFWDGSNGAEGYTSFPPYKP